MGERRSQRRPEGIVVRHTRPCPTRSGGRCRCRPGYQAQVFSARDGKTIRKTFATLADARAWRADTQTALRKQAMRAPGRTTLTKAADQWLQAAKAGIVRTRSGERYKPSALRGYEEALTTKLLPELGRLRLAAITHTTLQDLVDRLVAAGYAPSTVRNALLPLRAIYRRAVARQEILSNPTLGLSLPAVRASRERVARPAEAAALLDALREDDSPVWATALFAGLRRGELQALRWCDVNFAAGVLRVERSWDQRVGPVAPKSRSGRRRVPIAQPLRSLLAAQRLRTARGDEALVFGTPGGTAFSPTALAARAQRAWRDAGLAPLSLHECRHTYAAFMIAAGVNAKALCQYMGHASITVTLDRYGHLMPGAEAEAAEMLTAYLAR